MHEIKNIPNPTPETMNMSPQLCMFGTMSDSGILRDFVSIFPSFPYDDKTAAKYDRAMGYFLTPEQRGHGPDGYGSGGGVLSEGELHQEERDPHERQHDGVRDQESP